jgi:hypothetical protein
MPSAVNKLNTLSGIMPSVVAPENWPTFVVFCDKISKWHLTKVKCDQSDNRLKQHLTKVTTLSLMPRVTNTEWHYAKCCGSWTLTDLGGFLRQNFGNLNEPWLRSWSLLKTRLFSSFHDQSFIRMYPRCHDIRHNDTQHNDIQHENKGNATLSIMTLN